MKRFAVITFFVFSLSASAIANSCETSTGIDLSIQPGAYSGFWPRSQGSVGTCFAHASTDLLSTFIGGNVRLNVYDAAIAGDAAADGGQPTEVLEALIARGWACKDYGQYANFFPSQTKNIMTDLMDAVATSGMPVFYTGKYESKEGAARQQRIAVLAGKMASGEIRPCGAYLDAQQGVEEFKRLQSSIYKIEDKLEVLKDEKDIFDGWFGSRETSTINKEIADLIVKKNAIEIKSEKAHNRYTKGTDVLESGSNFMLLDNYSELQAAEIVYYWAERTYPAVKDAFARYGASASSPSMKQYIIGKVQRDPATGYWAAGGMYPYRLMKTMFDNACKGDNRIKIPKTIKTKSLRRKDGSVALTAKINSLLQKKPGQGVGITINSSILQSTNGTPHAVNLIGCRKVNGTKEYLIHNSWGSDCNSYHTYLRGPDKCKGGRVWIPASTVVNATEEIQWLEK